MFNRHNIQSAGAAALAALLISTACLTAAAAPVAAGEIKPVYAMIDIDRANG